MRSTAIPPMTPPTLPPITFFLLLEVEANTVGDQLEDAEVNTPDIAAEGELRM